MPPRIWPEKPSFKNSAEEAIFSALYDTLSSSDAILTNLHITDPKEGDCKIDVVALIQKYGVVVFETKGGNITYNGQTFVQSNQSILAPYSRTSRCSRIDTSLSPSCVSVGRTAM